MKKGLRSEALFYGDPRKTRTSGLRFRKPPLYPAELWGHAKHFCNISSREASAGRWFARQRSTCRLIADRLALPGSPPDACSVSLGVNLFFALVIRLTLVSLSHKSDDIAIGRNRGSTGKHLGGVCQPDSRLVDHVADYTRATQSSARWKIQGGDFSSLNNKRANPWLGVQP